MNVGVSQLVFGQTPLDEVFPKAASAGYDVIEIALRKEGELTAGADDAAIARVKELSSEHNLPMVSVVLCNCTGNLLADGEARRTSLDETKAGLETVRKLGVGCALHTLGRPSPDLYYDDAYRNAVASLKELAPEAERLDVAIAVEFIWNGFLFSPLEMKRFLDEVGSSHVGFYFDPGNMAVFNYPHHWARILRDHIKMCHMKDWQGRAISGGWTPLTEGDVDFPRVMKELRDGGYDGPLISEVSPQLATLEDTAGAIRRIMAM